VLRRRGFSVDAAGDGEDALARLGQCHYALLILDLMMPKRNGYDVIEQVAAMPPAKRPLILLLTAGLEAREFDPAVVVGTMRKPFDVQVLVDVVAATLATLPARAQREECPPVPPDEHPRDGRGIN
jgi:CheY-like chemotaxis protein